jgi:AcrR family transcriptional regulator
MKKAEAAENGGVKENRKTRYTKKALRESLIELMLSKSIVHITIKDICDLADISRSTFYAHYDNQYDLLKQIEEETIGYFENILKEYDKKRNKREIIETTEEILQYIVLNSNSIQVLLSENGDIDFQKKFISRFIHKLQVIDYFTMRLIKDPGLREYYAVYLISGSIALIQHWIKNNMNIPVPLLANMLVHLAPMNKAINFTP